MKLEELFDQAQKLRGEEKLDEAIEVYQQVIASSEDIGFLKAESMHMIGVICMQQGKYDLAKKNLTEALDIFKLLEDKLLIGSTLRDLAAIGKALDSKSGRVEKLLQDSVDHLKQADNNGHLGISLIKLGEYYLSNDQYNQAEQYIQEGFGLVQKSDEEYFKASAYFSNAKLCRYNLENDEAKKHAIQSVEILEKMNSHKSKQKEIEKFINNLD